MADERGRAVTIRITDDLYEEASLIANVEGVTMRSLVEEGVKWLVQAKTADDPSLGTALEAVRSHRVKLATF